MGIERYVLVVGFLGAGCLEASTLECADGRICPSGTQCDDAHGLCILDAQVIACEPLDDGDACEFGGVSGHCDQGVCLRDGCGDGVAAASEECDRDDWKVVDSCLDLDFHQAGTLSCRNDCTFDRTGCTQYCGDLVRNGPEDCDDQDLGEVDCQMLGYYEPDGLVCTSFCTFDISGCVGRCGDGIPNGDEVCDETLPTSGSCLDFGYDAGALGCSPFCTPGFDGCAHLRWMPESLPLTTVYDVWVGVGGEIFAISESQIAWKVGATWVVTTIGATLESIWGSGPTDVFVVGSGGQIHHFDGASWSAMTSPTGATLRSIWGSGPGDVFAVGTGGAIVHYDGAGWSTQSSGVTDDLNGVHGSGPGVVFAVGQNGRVRRYNGTSWVTVSYPAPDALQDVWVSSATSVEVIKPDTHLHYDGASWWFYPVAIGLTSIWGTAPTDLFATTVFGEMWQYDGTTWTRTQSQPGLPLYATHGTAPDDVVAGGLGTNLLHYRGAAWQAGFDASGRIGAVTRLGDGVLLAVGDAGRVYSMASGIETETTIAGGGDLWEVWGTSITNAWAGGFNDFWRKTASGWAQVTTPSSVSGLWGSSANNVFATRYNGQIYRWGGSSWTLMTSVGGTLLDIWGTGPSDVFAVGIGGIIHHYDGSAWSPMLSPTSRDLYKVSGSSGSDVFAVGDEGTVLHYDGSDWTVEPAQTASLLTGLSVVGPGDAFALGGTGTILHRDATAWSPVRFVTTGEVLDQVMAEPDRAFVVGSHGIAALVRTVPW